MAVHGFQDTRKAFWMAMAGCQVDVRLSGVQTAECELLQRLRRVVDTPSCGRVTCEEAVVLPCGNSRMDGVA